MSETPDPRRAGVRSLLRRLGRAFVKYRVTVFAMLGLGMLEAFFTKLPLLLVQPLMDELGGESGPGALPQPWLSPLLASKPPPEPTMVTSLGSDFTIWFRGFAETLATWLGMSFGSPGMNVIVACGFVAVLCGLGGAVTIYFVQTISRLFAVRVVADLRCELAEHFLNLPLRFFGKQRMGEMISRVTNNTQVVQRSFDLAIDNVVVDPMMILGNVVLIACTVPQAIWLLIVMVPLMAIPFYHQGRKVQKRSTKSLRAMGDTTESLSQILSGIRTVKAYQLERTRLQEFVDGTRVFLDRTAGMLRAKGRSMAQTFLGYQTGFAALLILLGYVVLVEGAVAPAAVAAVIAPLATTYQHVKRLTRSYHAIMESSGALHGIEEILGHGVDQAMVGGSPLAKVKGELQLRDLWFTYQDEPVLRGVSLDVQSGQTIAIVGQTGSGKSTLVDLLQRFHDPDQGAVILDGKDLREISLADYRRHTAVVSQDPFLFNTTIRENIACGKPDATEAEIVAAAQAANIHDFIAAQPLGYETPCGERGNNLSGGQKQRITIARAIVRNPEILFLDEATSALDSESEELVQRAIANLRRGRTSFVIAHRLSTIVSADVIVVLEQGRIVESGSHAELIAHDGIYRRMYELQTT